MIMGKFIMKCLQREKVRERGMVGQTPQEVRECQGGLANFNVGFYFQHKTHASIASHICTVDVKYEHRLIMYILSFYANGKFETKYSLLTYNSYSNVFKFKSTSYVPPDHTPSFTSLSSHQCPIISSSCL